MSLRYCYDCRTYYTPSSLQDIYHAHGLRTDEPEVICKIYNMIEEIKNKLISLEGK
jgi:hypothetical protein